MLGTIATVAGLSLYPVKSMSGTPVQEAHVGLDGILGDRLYSFVRAEQAAKSSFPWMTARESARMLLYRPRFTKVPTQEDPEPPVEVTTPDGDLCKAGDPRLTEEISRNTGYSLFLLKSARGIFDCQHVSVFSLASLRALATEAGCSIDPGQFRANIYIEPASERAYEEEGWTSYLLQIGAEVILAVTQRDARCMMVNINPETGAQDPRVLKTIAQRHQGQVGIYSNVVRPGTIRVGDAIRRVSINQ
jgi:MOSC domain-containing protein